MLRLEFGVLIANWIWFSFISSLNINFTLISAFMHVMRSIGTSTFFYSHDRPLILLRFLFFHFFGGAFKEFRLKNCLTTSFSNLVVLFATYCISCISSYLLMKCMQVLVDAECTHDGSIKHIQKFEFWGWKTLDRRVLDAERTDNLFDLQVPLSFLVLAWWVEWLTPDPGIQLQLPINICLHWIFCPFTGEIFAVCSQRRMVWYDTVHLLCSYVFSQMVLNYWKLVDHLYIVLVGESSNFRTISQFFSSKPIISNVQDNSWTQV